VTTPQRLTIVLTALNVMTLAFGLAQLRPAVAQDTPAVLRGHALELVDDRGRVRAELKVLPADPAVKMPDGTTGYPESVLLRLISSEGGPNVKLSATEDGAGLVLGGQAGYVQVLSRTADPSIKIAGRNGRTQVIK
jgi:hypothetical protein